MRTSTKISITLLTIFSVLIIVAVVLVLRCDQIVKSIANRQLQTLIAERQLPLSYSDINVNVLQGKIKINDLTLQFSQTDSLSADSACLSLSVKQVSCGHIHWSELWKEKTLHINAIRFLEPTISAYNLKNALALLPKAKTDTAQTHNIPLEKILIDEVSVSSGSLLLSESSTKLNLKTTSFSASVFSLGYTFSDSNFVYSDSLYLLSLNDIDFTSKDGLFRLQCDQLHTSNSGPLTLTNLRGGNTSDKALYSQLKGKIPVTWAQFYLTSLTTSNINLFRVVKKRNLQIDNLTATLKQASIYRDNQYQPKAPYPMPQEALLKIPLPFLIKTADISLKQMLIELTMTGKSVGQLHLTDLKTKLTNITNAKDKTIKASINTSVETEGKAQVEIALINNQQSDFSLKANVQNTKGEAYTDFLKPLFGVEVSCMVSNIDMEYHGNNKQSQGTYCMLYHGLKLNVLKDETPSQKLSKYSGLINTFAPAVIFESNPRREGQAPQTYTVSCTRNPKSNFAVYLMGPMLDGMIQTVLPPNIVKLLKKKIAEKQQTL